MSPEAERILAVYQARGLGTGAHIHPADFGDAIVWEAGFVREERSRAALRELFEGGYLLEFLAAFELTEVGADYIRRMHRESR